MFSIDSCAAVITGASSGLGAGFARQLAPRAARLLLAARREQPMQDLRQELISAHPGLAVHVCVCDLSTEGGRQTLLGAIRDADFAPDLLINNAGLGDYGAFSEADPGRIHAQMELNMTALVMLTHAMLPHLRRPGGILNVGSLAGALPMPGLAVYAASKAFVNSFSEALTIELAASRIQVTCVCPGPTPTGFSATATREGGQDTDRSGQDLLRMSPEAVIRAGLHALETGRPGVFPGLGVTLAAQFFRLMPRFLLRLLLRRRFHASISAPKP